MQKSITKAFLLAAGLGTRLRPLTNRIPKCLVPIDGKPLLSIWLDQCTGLGISDVLINTHYLADQVRAWATQQSGPVRINLVYEETLQGSAGTISANREFVADEEDFFIFYADNLVKANFSALISYHAEHQGVMTLALFHAPLPEACGIATLDSSGVLQAFEEKPERPQSDLANAGIYVARQSLFDFLPDTGFSDFGKDILPQLIGRASGYCLDGYLLDVGTLANYERACMEWRRLSIPTKPVLRF